MKQSTKWISLIWVLFLSIVFWGVIMVLSAALETLQEPKEPTLTQYDQNGYYVSLDEYNSHPDKYNIEPNSNRNQSHSGQYSPK